MDSLAPAVIGVKQNWRPMALVWAVAFAIVAAYYQSPGFALTANNFMEWKRGFGLAFAAVAGFVSGGILPELAKIVTRTVAKGENVVQEALFRGFVWVGLGVMVDIFYGFQAVWFGTGNDLRTLALKTAVDMFVFAPLLFVPYTVGMFVWRREKYSLRALASVYTPSGWRREVFPTYVPNVCFWIVVLLAVYALPTALQYPLSALATACWSILFTFLQQREVLPLSFSEGEGVGG